MARYCCVPLCKNGTRNTKTLSWHAFPSNSKMRKLWLTKIKIDVGKHFSISKHTVVCSAHFLLTDFKPLLHTKKKILKPEAFPSVFSWTKAKVCTIHMEKKILSTRNYIRRPKSSCLVIIIQRRKEPLHRLQSKQSVAVGIQRDEFDDNDAVNLQMIQINDDISVDTKEEGNKDPIPASELEAALGLLLLQTSTFEQLDNQNDLKKQIMDMQQNIEQLKEKIAKQQKIICLLKSSQLSVRNVATDAEGFRFYTSLPNYQTFCALLDYLKYKAHNLNYWRGKDTKSFIPRSHEKHDIEQEFFMTLVRLKLGMSLTELARNFHISKTWASKIFATWVNFLYCELKCLFVFPSKKVVHKTMPSQFQKRYKNTRIILDCFELRIERPSSIQAQKETFPNYKNYNTVKCLVGIIPNGTIVLVSKLYGGACSDKFIVKDSNVLQLLEPGDVIMADKGFEIAELLPPGVELNIPPMFKRSLNPQMPVNDVLKTREIASVRIHVERAIRRIKGFHILDGVLPLTMKNVLEQVVTVCSFLTNFQPALIKGDSS